MESLVSIIGTCCPVLRRIARRRKPLHMPPTAMGDLYEMRNPLCGRGLEAVRFRPHQAGRIDSLTGCRHAGWGRGALSTGCAWSLRKPANYQGKLGTWMCPSDEFWNVVLGNPDRPRRRLQRSGRFQSHSTIEPRLPEAGTTSDEPSGNEDPPALPPQVDRFGGHVTRNFRGDPPWQLSA